MPDTRVSLQLSIADLPLHTLYRQQNGCWRAYQLYGPGQQPVVSVCAPDGRLMTSEVPDWQMGVDGYPAGEWFSHTDAWGLTHNYMAESIKLKGHYAHPIFETKDSNMHPSVAAAWPAFIRQREGVTNWLYPDTHRNGSNWAPLPTTGTGNQIGDGQGGIGSFGLSLPWKVIKTDGHRFPTNAEIRACKVLATHDQIKAEWDMMKGNGLIGSGYAYQKYATLWLEQSVIDHLLRGKTDSNWQYMKKGFPDIEAWPADAQLAILDMAWWMGPSFYTSWPKLTGYLKAQNFYGAAANAISKAKAPRDETHRSLFQNAGSVLCLNTAVTSLWFPHDHEWRPMGKGTALYHFPTSVSVANLFHAKFLESWIAQSMLHELNFYKAKVDGQFGPMSRAAFAKFCKSKTMPDKIDADTVNLLSKESKWYLPAS